MIPFLPVNHTHPNTTLAAVCGIRVTVLMKSRAGTGTILRRGAAPRHSAQSAVKIHGFGFMAEAFGQNFCAASRPGLSKNRPDAAWLTVSTQFAENCLRLTYQHTDDE
jgi:hypothetical protein